MNTYTQTHEQHNTRSTYARALMRRAGYVPAIPILEKHTHTHFPHTHAYQPTPTPHPPHQLGNSYTHQHLSTQQALSCYASSSWSDSHIHPPPNRPNPTPHTHTFIVGLARAQISHMCTTTAAPTHIVSQAGVYKHTHAGARTCAAVMRTIWEGWWWWRWRNR